MINKTILIAGLGNPGEQYQTTPHNAGFLVIDDLLGTHDLQPRDDNKLKSKVAEGKIGNRKVILAKPQTFMNKSGEAVKALITNYKLPITSALWIIHDDIDLTLGKIKIVKNRGSAGHKGVEDVIYKLRTQDFVRFRIGTRPKRLSLKRSKTLMNKFVASPISKAEQTLLNKTIKLCAQAVALSLEEGIDKASSIYNQ